MNNQLAGLKLGTEKPIVEETMFWLFPFILICGILPLQSMENALGEIHFGQKSNAATVSPLYTHLKLYHANDQLFHSYADKVKARLSHDKWLYFPSKNEKTIKMELLLSPGYKLKLTRHGVTLDVYNTLFGISNP